MTDSQPQPQPRSFDILIVGAGPSAMGLLYGLLSPYSTSQQDMNPTLRYPPYTIAVVERGERNPWTFHLLDPKRWSAAAFSSPFSTVYPSVPQSALQHRHVGIPVGQGIGGGSNINACLVCRPSPDDFNHSTMKCSSSSDTRKSSSQKGSPTTRTRLWSAETIMTAADTIENVLRENGALMDHRNALFDVLGRCNDPLKSRGFGPSPCFSADPYFTTLVRKQNNGTPRRINYYDALIRPLLEANPHLHTFLHIFTGMQVERILFANPKKNTVISSDKTHSTKSLQATGVECSYSFQRHGQEPCMIRLEARRAVILCAGAILSPALLQVSGIGDSSLLQDIGVDSLWMQETSHEDTAVTRNQTFRSETSDEPWKAVGKNLQDHVLLPRIFLTIPRLTNRLRTRRRSISMNGVKGWMTVDIPPLGSQNETEKGRFFIKLFDGSATPWILPNMVFSVLNRSYLHYHSNKKDSFFRIHLLETILRCTASVAKFLCTFICICYPIRWFIERYTKVVAICLLKPESVGTVSLEKLECTSNTNTQKRHNRQANYPVMRLSNYDLSIDPKYLTMDKDMIYLGKAWDVSENVCEALFRGDDPHFCDAIEILPGKWYAILRRLYLYIMSDKVDSEDDKRGSWLSSYAANFAVPYYHWSGSLRMSPLPVDTMGTGNDESYVVHDDLHVRNTRNLFVCCASVFPNPISGPTALTCVALGFAAARAIVDSIHT